MKNRLNYRISLSDLMTGLMLIFMLIAISVISQLQIEQQKKQDIVKTYISSKEDIYKDLKSTFSQKEKQRDMTISSGDLTMKFENPDVLFDINSANLKPKFKQILDEFIPKYIALINKDQYTGTIKEVRIEGHTRRCDASDKKGINSYLSCMNLSQQRAFSVVSYMLNHKYVRDLDEKDQEKLLFWLMSVGLSSGRQIDVNNEFSYQSRKQGTENSKRVEFKIVTNSDIVIDQIKSF